MTDLEHCELVELDGKHFITLIERRSAFSIELMRVVSSVEQRAEKPRGVNGAGPDEPEAAPDAGGLSSATPKAVA